MGWETGRFAWAAVCGVWLSALAAVGAALACPPAAGELRSISGISNSGELSLGNSGVVRLMGILLPSARDLPVPPQEWPAGQQALAALEGMLGERTARIAATGGFTDRYDRQVAHAFSGSGPWLQAALVDAGFARVAPLPGETACLTDLLAREAVARARRVGLWANPTYALQQARETRSLLRLTGTFQIVEGWVSDTGASRSEVFLNFGRNWRWDFTAAVDLRRSADRETIAARLKALKGRLVRVRGFIQRRNGPFVALASEEAIEELPEGAAGR